MAQCPNCGRDIPVPSKSWPVTFKKPDQVAQPQFSVGIFECPDCKCKFRARVRTIPSQSAASPNVASLVERINTIRQGLAQTLKTLHLKIRTLETERAALLAEAEELKNTAEKRAEALESEINQLREEIKSMCQLLETPVNEADLT